MVSIVFVFFKHKTAYELRISDWSSDVCSSDLLEHIDFAPRAAMLEQAASVVVEMIHELKHMDLDRMSALNEKLRSLENEADRLMLELYRDIYSGKLDHLQMFLLKEFFEILEKDIDRCSEAGEIGRASGRERVWQEV